MLRVGTHYYYEHLVGRHERTPALTDVQAPRHLMGVVAVVVAAAMVAVAVVVVIVVVIA